MRRTALLLALLAAPALSMELDDITFQAAGVTAAKIMEDTLLPTGGGAGLVVMADGALLVWGLDGSATHFHRLEPGGRRTNAAVHGAASLGRRLRRGGGGDLLPC